MELKVGAGRDAPHHRGLRSAAVVMLPPCSMPHPCSYLWCGACGTQAYSTLMLAATLCCCLHDWMALV